MPLASLLCSYNEQEGPTLLPDDPTYYNYLERQLHTMELLEARELTEQELTTVTGGTGTHTHHPERHRRRRHHHHHREDRGGYDYYGYDDYGYDNGDDDGF
jgi:hypothetical protein